MQNRLYLPVAALALGHLVTDMQAGALPIVLPQLKELFSLSYSQLAAIVLLQNIMSSVIQPAFGYLTDKRSLPRLLPVCAALAGAGFAFVGFVPSYALLLCTVVFISLASATYHPQASKTVNFLSDDSNRAKNMGLFSIGGNAGMAFGSMLMTFLLGLAGGLRNTVYFVLPGLLVFGLMAKCMPDYQRVNVEHAANVARQKSEGTAQKFSYFGLFLILFYIFMRSSIHSGISTYLPLFFIKFRGFEPVAASALVSSFLLGGVGGTYVGSVLSDKLGARKILLGSITLSIPAIFAVTVVTTQALAVSAAFLSGFFIIGSFATTIILAQCMMPNNVGMASGLTIGFSVGLGGFGVTILGFLADRYGLPFIMQLLVWLPIVAALVALRIPIPKNLQK
ncbi:MAG: MFS transporter [Phascolarctobacterium sp.]|uniref:MFS transporter n=1 Tax=Phascolarctobacterium sp. TaxID=2049039 RepID=UPI0026DB46BB|nr:MFS transporter [Phascolarctobacterium sp.]MDO4921843.1 MFS transporter [Phascolarctobacterium sp.]